MASDASALQVFFQRRLAWCVHGFDYASELAGVFPALSAVAVLDILLALLAGR